MENKRNPIDVEKEIAVKKTVYFLNKSYEIDPLNPPTTVVIPRHNIMDNLGRDTGIECPVKTGHVFTHKLLGSKEITHEVVILCESAKKPYDQQIGNFAQCRTSTSTRVKCHET